MLNSLSDKFGIKKGKELNEKLNKMTTLKKYDKFGELLICNIKDVDIIMNTKNYYMEKFKNLTENEIELYINPPEIQEGGYKCIKCNSEKTFFYQLQTRSSDEPMTTFITCSNCSNKWKE